VGSGDELSNRLDRLELIERARGLQADYADIIDRRALDELGSIFAPGVALTASGKRFEGLEAVVGFYRAALEADTSPRRHFITNVRVVEADHTSATLTAYFCYTAGVGGRSMIGWGRYRDRFRMIGDELRFHSKEIVVDRRGPVGDGWGDDPAVTRR
jgi:hypothetical protein